MTIRNILVRRCLPLSTFDESVAFYEKLVGQPARLRFDYPEYNLKLAQVASILFIGGSETSLEPFIATDATFLVDDLEAYSDLLAHQGGTIVDPIKTVPTGRNMLVRHPDGMLVEYVQHRAPHPDDRL